MALGSIGTAKLAGQALKNAKGGSSSLRDRSRNMATTGGGGSASGAVNINLGEILKPMTKPPVHGGLGYSKNSPLTSSRAVNAPSPKDGIPWAWVGAGVLGLIGVWVYARGGF